MSTEPGCRISKVKLKGAAEITVLHTRPTPEHNGTSNDFIETLIYILGRARHAQCIGYAVCALFDRTSSGDEGTSTLQAIDINRLDGTDKLLLLGALRSMEEHYQRRIFDKDDIHGPA